MDLYQGYITLAILWLTALAPLAMLLTKVKEAALLCPVLVLFLVLPARVSSADALNRYVRGGAFFTPALVDYAGYYKKLAFILKQLAIIALFAIPIAALIGYVVYLWFGGVDVITLIILIKNMGGTIQMGLFVCLLIFMAAAVPILIGMGLFCADRFYFSGRKEPAITRVKRLTALKSGFYSFCMLLPAILFIIAALLIAVPRFVESLTQDRSGFRPALFLMGAAFLYYLFTAPLRKLITPIALNMRDEPSDA